MNIDLSDFLIALGGIITAITAYRAGIGKNKSLETETTVSLHELATSDAERYRKHLSECRAEYDAIYNLMRRWRTGFSILKAEMRNARVKNSQVSFADIENKTLAALEDIRNGISNV